MRLGIRYRPYRWRRAYQKPVLPRSIEPSQYSAAAFRAAAAQLGVRRSMGRTGSCFDYAAAESFFAVLKTEIGTRVWPSRTAARADVFRFIEVHYNRRRLHSTLGYRTPHETRTSYSQGIALTA